MKGDVLNKIKSFDAYPKSIEDFRIQTKSGSISLFILINVDIECNLHFFLFLVSILAILFIIWLLGSEIGRFFRPGVHSEIFVDPIINEKIKINIDITFPRLSCSYIGLDIIDAAGNHQLNAETNIEKIRLDVFGRKHPVQKEEFKTIKIQRPPDYCGPCYGSEDAKRKCCNSCEEVQEQYRKKGWRFDPEIVQQCQEEGYLENIKKAQSEGCRIVGFVNVNKINGNFHFAPGKAIQTEFSHIHDIDSISYQNHFDLSHTIKDISFGDHFPGRINPLLYHTKRVKSNDTVAFNYYMKVVPTIYEYSSGKIIHSNQYSLTEHNRILHSHHHHKSLPGVFFEYEFAPLIVKYTQKSVSFGQFFVSICAIIGGVLAVGRMIDSFVYGGLNSLKKKVELGKHN